MKRSHKLAILLLALVSPLVAFGAVSAPKNVLFISVDDMNDWVGCLGSNRVPTPNIDALAARGLLFINAHAPSPKCGPSRAAILTGKRASTTGLYGNGHWWRPAYPDLLTLPHYFKKNGYYSAGGGKVHHHTDGFNPPDQWDEYFDLVQDKDLIVDYFNRRGEDRRYLTDQMPRHPNDSLDWGSMEVEPMEMGDAQTVNWASEFLSREHDKPFFLAVGIFQPHLPFYAPKQYFDALPQKDVDLPINKPGDLDDIPEGGQIMAEYRRNDLRMIEEYNELENCVRSYLASIAHADTMVGELMNAFDKSAYTENTIIVLWSDHGYAFGEKDHYAKNTLWERSTHVPLIMVVPEVTKPGTRTDAPVDLTCLYPTLTTLCDLPTPSDLDGVNVTPLLKTPNIPWKHPAIIDYLKGNTAIRTKDWRYISYDEGRKGEELYDTQSDPNEWTNLISTHGEFTKQFKAWLPEHYPEEVPTKRAYHFDSDKYEWRLK